MRLTKLWALFAAMAMILSTSFGIEIANASTQQHEPALMAAVDHCTPLPNRNQPKPHAVKCCAVGCIASTETPEGLRAPIFGKAQPFVAAPKTIDGHVSEVATPPPRSV